MLTLTFNIQPVKAEGTIYIRADGSIDPPTAPISTVDNVTYTLTGNIASDADGIVVERSNIIIDGDGYMLQGTGAYASKGIDLSGRSNVTSKNTNIKDFSYGILLSDSSNISITGNHITNNRWGGIGLWGASNNTISGNHITNNSGIGITLTGLFGSSNNRVAGNVLVNDGLSVWNSYGNVIVDNLVNGKPLVYLEGVSDVVVEDAGQVILVNCNSIKVENLNLSNTYIGVQLWRTRYTTIAGNNITNNSYGISLEDSSNNNSISGNTIANNSEAGIRLTYGIHSKNNSIVGNYIINNGYGIESGAENSISGNTITNNSIGISLDSSYYSSIVGNQITNNSYGISFGSWSNYNGISENNITNNEYGIRLSGSSNNSIVGNNIAANNWTGILLRDSSNYNSVHENNITNNYDGIALEGSSENIISGNNITNRYEGIFLFGSSNNNTLFGNNISDNQYGIEVVGSSGNTLFRNNITNNSDEGIYIHGSSGNTVFGNNIANNRLVGIDISLDSSNNTICGNKIVSNECGIRFYQSSNNFVYHNNFKNNTYQVYTSFYISTNVWDNGYPSGGNYWSDYSGVDQKDGLNQDQLGSDGIGDTPYVISPFYADIRDRYPLMAPFSAFDAGDWNGEAYSVDIISNSTLSDFKLNTTQKTLSFNVTGIEGNAGFCRVTIPNAIVENLWQGNYTVLLNGEPWPFRNWTDATNTYIYINYTHSEHEIIIVPEFPSFLILPVFMVLSMFAAVFAKRKFPRKQNI
jgi:parallel beta-helix repeat protein